VKSDAENSQLIEGAKEKLRLLVSPIRKSINWSHPDKSHIHIHFQYYSPVGGYVVEEDACDCSDTIQPIGQVRLLMDGGMNGGSSGKSKTNVNSFINQ